MSLNPLTPVTDYQSMLNRIFWFTSASSLIAVWMLRMKIPALDTLLTEIDFNLEFGGDKILPVPGGYLLPALAIGLGSRVFRIHSLLAKCLGIRERFDIDVIIGELARRSGIDIEDVTDEALIEQRHKIMRHGFYQFVGGSDPHIEKQLIHRALDLWSWFWIGLEAAVVFVVTGFAWIAIGLHQQGLIVIISALGSAAIGLPIIRNECRRYAIAQVRAIVADSARVEQVRRAFDPLLALRPSVPRAA